MSVAKKTIILFFPCTHPEGNYANFPWSLLYLERMIRHLDVNLILLDERLDKDYDDIIINHKEDILFAGVSAILGYQVVGGAKFSRIFKSITDAPLIWGGWFPTIFPEMIMSDETTDYICLGQGEIPFREFTERMLNGREVSDLAGIGYKKNGNIVINKNQGLINPNSFPRINMSLIDVNRLIDLNGKMDKAIRGTEYLATTGCPHCCSFCNLTEIAERKWFHRPVPEIIADLKYLKENASVSHIVFIDDNFFAGRRFILDFCRELKKSGLIITWEAHAHVGFFLKYFSNDDISIIRESGCVRVIVGAESGDQDVLELLNKETKAEDNLRIVRVLKKHNIRTRLHTMVCFPQDPDKDFFRTLNLVGRALIIDRSVQANIKFYKPVPKTALYQKCIKNGFVPPSSTNELIDSFSHFITAPWYNRNYHKELDIYVNFYFLFADPFYYKTYPLGRRSFIFLLNVVMYLLVRIRFQFNWMRFPIEARFFRGMIRSGKISTFLDSVSVNKTKYSSLDREGEHC